MSRCPVVEGQGKESSLNLKEHRLQFTADGLVSGFLFSAANPLMQKKKILP